MGIDYDGIATLLDAATTTGAGLSVFSRLFPGPKTFQAVVEGEGAVSATVLIECSNDDEHWMELGSIALTGTASDTDGFESSAAWAYHRANVTAISGTGAAVTVKMGA